MNPTTIQNATTFEELLLQKYGEKGSEKREEFEAKAQAFYICEMLREEREKQQLTQADLAEKNGNEKGIYFPNRKWKSRCTTFYFLKSPTWFRASAFYFAYFAIKGSKIFYF